MWYSRFLAMLLLRSLQSKATSSSSFSFSQMSSWVACERKSCRLSRWLCRSLEKPWNRIHKGQNRETYFLKKTEREGLGPLPKGSRTPSPACSAFQNRSALKVGSSESERNRSHIYLTHRSLLAKSPETEVKSSPH